MAINIIYFKLISALNTFQTHYNFFKSLVFFFNIGIFGCLGLKLGNNHFGKTPEIITEKWELKSLGYRICSKDFPNPL